MYDKETTKAFDTCVRLLAVRARSEYELRQKLYQKKYASEVIDGAIKRCYLYNYIDDQAYAKAKAESLARTGQGFGLKTRMVLKKAGVAADLIEKVVEDVSLEYPECDVVSSILERKFSSFNYADATDKERRRVCNYFLRRGFSPSTVFEVIRQ